MNLTHINPTDLQWARLVALQFADEDAWQEWGKELQDSHRRADGRLFVVSGFRTINQPYNRLADLPVE